MPRLFRNALAKVIPKREVSYFAHAVISLLRHRDTLIAERLEGFGREFRALQFLYQQHIRFASFQPCCDMGQPRADRIQIPLATLNMITFSNIIVGKLRH